jgi:CBS domain-containing protein
MKVRNLYNATVISAGPEESLVEAATRMRTHGVSSLAVLDAGRLVGIITERDMVDALSDGVSPQAAQVSAYMAVAPEVAQLDEDSKDVAMRMLELGVRHLPVVDGEEVVGVISARDLLMLQAWPEPGAGRTNGTA